MRLDELLDSEGFTEACEGCPHYKTWTEWHPYGSTVAGEPMADCLSPSDVECKRLPPNV